ncbi:16S rRNA (cytidine(1402)-2'-O)-methyltransferase [Altericroceibacterium spongiae]|uniref:16S rRNA (cytidine(1402)-2'-O)-methyltransferase n=1 Tax=Altericroceibacterium spongiae TaxID=2320269 RepID=UPI001EE5BAEB|nr:16S rRNA (cytidine(1402)-2'-O)-methyltransferase [Altericroceibacterium spongiae]
MSDAPENNQLSPGLYIVATPIGNLGDITMRAADILARCDAIACEDTRVTQKLIRHLGITRPLWRYDDHSAESDRAHLLEKMRDQAIALVSDAGTPLVSDPGYRLVKEAQEAGIAVTSLPGPSAPVMALTLSGMPNDRFLFAGFLPPKEKARRDILIELSPVRATLVFFETAPRLLKSLDTIGDSLPGREVAVARELTKRFEECRRGTAEELTAYYTAHPPKGEIVLLIGPPLQDDKPDDTDIDALLSEAMAEMKTSQAAGSVAKATGLDRKMLYTRAMELKGR